MEEKKNNKGLVWLIVVLIILVLGLIGYIVYDKVLLKEKNPVNNDGTTTTTTVKQEDRKVGDCYNVNGTNRCIAFKEKNIEIEYEKNDDSEKYFINDNLIFEAALCDINNPIIIDKDYVILDCGPEESSYSFFNSDGNASPLDFNNINEFGNINYVEYKDATLITKSYDYGLDYEAALCRDKKDDDIVYIEQKTKYQGDGVFSKTEIVKTKTAREVVQERFNMTCEEIKTTTNPDMEYHKYLATGE